ncbi:helix-turn-helix domain-containing protein [Enterobacter hormaechei]
MVTAEPLTAQKAAKLLKVSPRTVYRLIDSGQLAGKKIGNKYRTTDVACIAFYMTRAILFPRARVNIKEKFYVNHPQRRHLALSFRYAVREKN